MKYIAFVTGYRSPMRVRRVAPYVDGTNALQPPESGDTPLCTSTSKIDTIGSTIHPEVDSVTELFDIVGDSFFSLLSSKNKHIYFRALMVLRTCYQSELRLKRADLVAYFVEYMLNDLMDFSEENDEPADAGSHLDSRSMNNTDGDEATTLSGRAHALVRRFQETGWLDVVPDEQSMDEMLLVPDHASAILDVLHSIVHPVDRPYNSYVYSTYSVLRTANEDRDYMYPALQSAYDNTQSLLDSLRALLHNIHKFYRSLQQRSDIRELLEDHFDGYQVLVATKTYHPLKTVDSVHRFRPRILSILRQWLADGEVMDLLVQSMATHRSGFPASESRYEIIRMIQFIMESLESMDTFLREIDRRNSSYSRASVERIQYLLNTDRDVKGKLVEIMKLAPGLNDDRPNPLLHAMLDLPLYRVSLADAEALYTEPQRHKRGTPVPLDVQDAASDEAFQAEAKALIERVNSFYSHERIVQFILSQMSDAGVLDAEDMQIRELEDYLRTMVAVIQSDERNTPYQVMWEPSDGSVTVGRYRIPALSFLKKATTVRRE